MGRGGLIVAAASFLGVPGNNSICGGGNLAQCAVQGGNWATEQPGSPQGALVTEGTETQFSRPRLFSGLQAQSLGPPGDRVTQGQSLLLSLIIQKGVRVSLEQLQKQSE